MRAVTSDDGGKESELDAGRRSCPHHHSVGSAERPAEWTFRRTGLSSQVLAPCWHRPEKTGAAPIGGQFQHTGQSPAKPRKPLWVVGRFSTMSPVGDQGTPGKPGLRAWTRSSRDAVGDADHRLHRGEFGNPFGMTTGAHRVKQAGRGGTFLSWCHGHPARLGEQSRHAADYVHGGRRPKTGPPRKPNDHSGPLYALCHVGRAGFGCLVGVPDGFGTQARRR